MRSWKLFETALESEEIEVRLPCDNIEATKATQVRTKLHKDVIDAYCEDIKNGAKFPPIDVFCEKGAERCLKKLQKSTAVKRAEE